MAELTFKTLSFRISEDVLQVILLKLFTTSIPIEEVKSIGDFEVLNSHTIDFSNRDPDKVETKFSFLLANARIL